MENELVKIEKTVLMSFVGTNDAGQLLGKDDGAILTALKEQAYNEVILLWNTNSHSDVDYLKISKYLGDEIIKRQYAQNVKYFKFSIDDVSDHNLIYRKLKEFSDNLLKEKGIAYTAAISSGTPAMQVCWILLSESGEFSEEYPLKLIRIRDPKFGKPAIIPVKLNTTLPQIIKLKSEIQDLKNASTPKVKVSSEKGTISIDGIDIQLPPMEFSYYKYFLMRAKKGQDFEKFSGINVKASFIQDILSIHETSFPELELNRYELSQILKKDSMLAIGTFRSNISKLNTKLLLKLSDQWYIDIIKVSCTGMRGAKLYGVKLLPQNIEFLE